MAACNGEDGLRGFEDRFEIATKEGLWATIGAATIANMESEKKREAAWTAFDNQQMYLRKWERRLKRAKARGMSSPEK